MIIYKIENRQNGKVYVGQTTRTLEERMKEHMRNSRTAIDKSIQKYGIDLFDVSVIDEADSIEELNEKEIYWISKYNSLVPNGYNMCNGGDNTCDFHHSEESKRKMSVSKASLYVGEC